MAELTTHQMIEEINRQKKVVRSGKAFEIAVKSIVAEQTVRIFQKGQKSDGTPIGQYNRSKPLYVYTPPAPKKVTGKGKKGKKIKGGYYKNYAAFRQQQGRESGFVNIRLTNELQSDFANSRVGKSSKRIAKARPIKINRYLYQVLIKKAINIQKVQGLEGKYGAIFAPTRREQKRLVEFLNFELQRELDA